MPKAVSSTTGSGARKRVNPYARSSPKTDKENVDPNSKSASKEPQPGAKTAPASKEADRGDYRDIEVEEINEEVPCYDNAATVRRKLKKLLESKDMIPGTNKKWSQASMSAEMQDLESRGHPVPYNRNATGPSARSLGNFMKKSGLMGAGDSPSYYWGYVMLEKLRIWNGEKKSKAREKAEEEIPNGHERIDPKTARFLCGPGLPPPSMADLANAERR